MLTRALSHWLMSIALATFALVAINLLVATTPTQARHASLINCAGSIQACIDAANDGDTILIAAGRYTESLTLSKPVSLTGENRDTTIIHAIEGQRVLTVTGATIGNSVVISGLTFTGGSADIGGGILVADTAHPLLQSLVIAGNQASFGGGLYAENGISVYDTLFINNGRITETSGGGGAFIQGAIHLSNVQFISNTSGSVGGGIKIWYGGPAFITNSLFADNTSVDRGGGIDYEGTASFSLSNTQVIRNSSGEGGGGAYVSGASTISVINSRFEQNTSQEYSAGLHANSDRLVLINTVVLSNTVLNPPLWGYAAGVSNLGTVEAIDSTFENNSGSLAEGGGLWGATIYLTNTDFISNSSSRGGGLYGINVYMEGGRLERNTSTFQPGGGISGFDVYLSGTVIISNVASGGAGVFAGGYELVLNRVRVESNRAVGFGTFDYSYGGGIWTGGQLIISDSQILNNTAAKGGGVSISGVGPETSRIVNSVLAGNTATESSTAIYINAAGQYDLIHTTIAGSTFVTQPAITILSGTLNLTNTIIANHAIGISNTGGTVYEDYNLFFGNVTNTIDVTSGGHSLVGDPKFIDPFNGDYHLQFGSAAIDRGVDVGVYVDLDGKPRPVGAGFDIGAYEYQAIKVMYLPVIRK